VDRVGCWQIVQNTIGPAAAIHIGPVSIGYHSRSKYQQISVCCW